MLRAGIKVLAGMDDASFLAAMKQVPANAQLAKRWTDYGGELVCNTPAQFEAFIKSDRAMWGKVIRQAGVRLD